MMDYMNPSYMVASFIVSLFGMALWAWGRNLDNIAVKWIGGVLMLAPVLTTNIWALAGMAVAGVALAMQLR
ncbi:MAG: hypothetical protein CVV64_15515 [Candidatus Wallbacteria bacterium HGW-Wallbacteria-1]|jgi:hypothetical protein|uniref:Amino acid transport protein n=1 Tax=Candidatus Wallbacteria bacterium HGW-Wallbacteria-1 TaxID=2013854 RepID=A0A2N1PLJ4_9BACT|nr:MAG: hypothetical protein CVV64_15515 [Candidatus Wallbacteria bacterium HGW-Wallbacteria-1]